MYVAFDSPVLALQRVGDALLVEVVMDAEVDQQTLKWLNWCRLWSPSSTLTPIVQFGCDCLTAFSQAFVAVSLSPIQAKFDILSFHLDLVGVAQCGV